MRSVKKTVAVAGGLAAAVGICGAMACTPVPALAVGTDQEIEPGATVSGALGSGGQENVYRVKAPADGWVKFEIAATWDSIDYEVWSDSAELYDDDNPLSPSEGTVATGPIAAAAGEDVELRVSAFYPREGAEYTVRAVVETPGGAFESEPNDEEGQETPVRLGTVVWGVQNVGVWDRGSRSRHVDVDRFSHEAGRDGWYTVRALVKEGGTAGVGVFSESGGKTVETAVGTGVGWVNCGKVALARGQRLGVSVTADDHWLSTSWNTGHGLGTVYQLEVRRSPFRAPATPALKSVSGGKRSLVAKWGRVSGATGYQVRWSTSKKMSGAKTKTVGKSKGSAKAKGLKSGKRYYVQVRSYAELAGKPFRSGWSRVVSAKAR